MNKKISIIVPAYNVENYIERCIDSLVYQDLPDDEYEIIVVNDGSTDTTKTILETYTKKETNVFVFSVSNRGVSEARNYGCEKANGKYLLFVDADDWIKPEVLRTLYETMEREQLDLMVMDYRYWDASGELPKALHFADRCRQGTDVLSGVEFMQKCLPPVVWSIVYRSSFWHKHHFKFLPIRHEDEELIPRVFYFAERVKFLPLDFYNYYQNQDSFMMNYDERSCFYMLRAMESLETFRLQQVKGDTMNLFFQSLIARNLLKSFKRSVRWGASSEIQRKMIVEMKKSGLSPIVVNKGGFYALLYNYLPLFFIAYYRLKLRNTAKR